MSLKAKKQFFYKANRLQQLRGFCLAAQLENVSRAAAQLRLSPSTVSLQIKSLEQDLDVALFTRRGPKLLLTDAGKRLLELSLEHVEAIEEIDSQFRREAEESRSTSLHLAANATGIQFLLPQLVRRLTDAEQDVAVTIHFAEQEKAVKKLSSGDIEAALLPVRQHLPFPKSLRFIPLSTFEAALITRPDHPLAGRRNLSIQEIAKYDLALPAEELRVIPNLYEIFPMSRIKKRLRINFVDWETSKKYIDAGLVISISSTVIMEDDDSLCATPLSHLFPDSTYGFLLRKSPPSPKLEKLIELARRMSVRQEKRGGAKGKAARRKKRARGGV